MKLDDSGLRRALTTLGAVLDERGLGYEVVVVGGSALLLLGILSRPTRDLDVVALVEHGRYVRADDLPEGLVTARDDVARTLVSARTG